MLAPLSGMLAAVLLAAVATLGGAALPAVGGPVCALLLGVVARSLLALPAELEPGLALCSRRVLPAAIVLSGFGLSFASVAQVGIATLPVALITIAVALVGAVVFGRALGLSRTLQALIGVGTAICGASAIAAVATVLVPSATELGIAIATIFTYNVVAVVLFPPIGHVLGLSQHAFGVWAGTAINDTSSVLAAGFAYGAAAGAQATIVKLTRATMILPIVAAIAFARLRRARIADGVPWKRVVPWFILWFVLAACTNSAGFVPAGWHAPLAASVAFFITLALAAIGLQTNVAALRSAGIRPLALGMCLWIAVAATSLAVQRFDGW